MINRGMRMNNERELDCFGEMCPIPVLRIKEELKSMREGDTLKVISDHSCVVESIKDHFTKKQLYVEVEEAINGVWEIFITLR